LVEGGLRALSLDRRVVKEFKGGKKVGIPGKSPRSKSEACYLLACPKAILVGIRGGSTTFRILIKPFRARKGRKGGQGA